MALLLINPSDPLVTFVLLVPMTLCSAVLEAFSSEGRKVISPTGNITVDPLNWKLSLLPNHSGLLMPMNQ